MHDDSPLPIWSFLIFFFVTSTIYLYHNELNCDVGWNLYSMERLLNGAILYIDIVEPNFPLTFYFWIIPVWIGKTLKLSTILCAYTYLFIISGYCLYLCWKLLNNLVELSPVIIRTIFLSLVFIIWLYPTGNHGQREHLMVIMCLPYFLVAVNRSLNKPIIARLSIAAGILAGIGIAFKPHFILLYVIIEGYLIFLQRTRYVLKRPENMAILTIIIVYYTWTFYYFDIYRMIVLANETYFAYNCSIKELLINQDLLIWTVALILFIIFIKTKAKNHDIQLPMFLMVISIGCMLIYFIQKKGYQYHCYPVGAISIIITALLVTRFAEIINNYKKRNFININIIAILFIISLFSFGVLKCVRHYIIYRNGEIPKMIDIVREYAANKPIYIFSIYVRPSFPLINHSGSLWTVRFPCLWPLPAMYYGDYSLKGNEINYHYPDRMGDTERFVMESVISDLEKNQPELLIFDQRGFIHKNADSLFIEPHMVNFDFIKYFAQNDQFIELLRDYNFIGNVDCYWIYRLNKDAKQG